MKRKEIFWNHLYWREWLSFSMLQNWNLYTDPHIDLKWPKMSCCGLNIDISVTKFCVYGSMDLLNVLVAETQKIFFEHFYLCGVTLKAYRCLKSSDIEGKSVTWLPKTDNWQKTTESIWTINTCNENIHISCSLSIINTKCFLLTKNIFHQIFPNYPGPLFQTGGTRCLRFSHVI